MFRIGGNRIIVLVSVFFLLFSGLGFRYFSMAVKQEYVSTAFNSSFITIYADETHGTVFDRNMNPLVNREYNYSAVIVPCADNHDYGLEMAENKAEFEGKFLEGEPFLFSCINETEDSDSITVFRIPERYSENQKALHVTGYVSDNTGVSGIEYAYDKVLRGGNSENSVTYSTDGFGNILLGDGKSVIRSDAEKTGVVTTIDSHIQEICERFGKDTGKGAVIVSDVKSGDILGLASFPEYRIDELEKAVSNENSPLINRALYSYSVGSVFKLVTACEGIKEGYGNYIYSCIGNTDISGQNFNCHKYDGHGIQNMNEAMKNSCNTYFINMSRSFDVHRFRELARSFGFGREIYLCAGMTASAGVLPDEDELQLPAELANFSFGQGKLSATPLQINQFTCAIANRGELPMLRIIRGFTYDGETVSDEKSTSKSRAVDRETAEILKDMMISAVNDNSESNAVPYNVKAGAKTSTAQTGRYDKSGNEYCHAWITGFIPADKPRYAITVLAEDGGYGNEAAAPVFRHIAENIADYDIIELKN